MNISALNSIDSLLRRGEFQAARKRINAALNTPLTRSARGKLAQFARRAGLPQLGVPLLHSLVRPKPRSPVRALPLEIAEYAAALTTMGATDEALQLLDSLNPADYGAVRLFQALGRIQQRDHDGSLPPLLAFIEDPRTPPDLKSPAELKLAAGYIHTSRHTQAEELLSRLRQEDDAIARKRVLRSALVLSCENAVVAGDLATAREFIRRAETHFPDDLSVHKWRAVADLKADPSSADARQRLKDLMQIAERLSAWEAHRNCEYHLAVATENYALLLKVYFGTPFPSYRQEIQKLIPRIPDHYVHGSGRRILDLNQGSVGSAVLPHSQVPHCLLKILASDLYRPQPLAGIHAKLFPERHYDPQCSPAVVHQALKRLRAWFTEHKIPLRIRETDSHYRLENLLSPEPQLALKYRKVPQDRTDHRLRELIAKHGKGPWAATQVASALDISRQSALNFLNEAILRNRVSKTGTGSRIAYRAL